MEITYWLAVRVEESQGIDLSGRLAPALELPADETTAGLDQRDLRPVKTIVKRVRVHFHYNI